MEKASHPTSCLTDDAKISRKSLELPRVSLEFTAGQRSQPLHQFAKKLAVAPPFVLVISRYPAGRTSSAPIPESTL